MATAAEIASLRQMIDDTSDSPQFGDEELASIIDKYPLPATGDPPVHDLALAASDAWLIKAARLADMHDVSVDGTGLSRSQLYEHCVQMSQLWSARRHIRTATLYRSDMEQADA